MINTLPVRNPLCVAALAFLVSISAIHAVEPRTFPHPDRIRYDSNCLTIDGKDTFIYSGAFHYFRCPQPLWRDRFQKIKAAGFNTVETYIPWNWHEQGMPKGLNDFSQVDLAEFENWLKMAEEFGFYIIARPGPYICAEWDTGGFPQWLLTKKPADWKDGWLRSDEPVFLAWSKHWYDAVCPIIARHQITHKAAGKPGIILFQLENEYDFARFPDETKIRHIRALAETARANGIDVPMFTCWTKQVRGSSDPLLRQVFDSCNFYPRWNVDGELRPKIAQLRAQQPDAPLMTTELQGGWFSKVGGVLSEQQEGVTAEQINNLTLLAIEHGETVLNYYMLFGGSNPGDWGARDMTTTYDYNAPIREWGGVSARYGQVQAIGRMLREHGARLARAEAVPCDVTISQGDVTVIERRARDGGRYLFVRTSQHAAPRQGTAQVKETGDAPEIVFDYTLEPFGSKVLYLAPGVTDGAKGEWLPKAAPAIERPAEMPARVEITSAQRCADPGPARWSDVTPGHNLAQAGIYDDRFVFYRIKVSASVATNLVVEHAADDTALALANGKLLPRVPGPSSASGFTLPPGSNTVMLLYENLGHANGGIAMEQPSGLSGARLISPELAQGNPITGWRMREVDGTNRRDEVKSEFKDDDWTPVALDSLEGNNVPPGKIAVYRATIEVSKDDLTSGMNLNFGRIDGLAWVYVNGRRIGQTGVGARAYCFDATKALHSGRNVAAVIVQNNQGIGGLGLPGLARTPQGVPMRLDSFGTPTGIDKKWWQPGFNDKRWEAIKIGAHADSAQSTALLTWYRLRFKLESPKRGVWVPWRLRLNASGNGFLYLNGHPLGRYWEAGPQHDFFLPECWLNFGSKNNILTLNLRPAEKGAAIESASVEPCPEFAERR